MMIRRRLLALPVVLVVAAVLAACGDDRPPTEPEASPGPGVTVFVQGEFGRIPLLPRSSPVSEREEREEEVAQTFSVRNTAPEGVLQYYERILEPEWEQTVEIHKVGEAEDAAFRAEWVRAGRRLLVSAFNAPTLEPRPGADDSPIVQYSLVLSPIEAPAAGEP